MSAVNVGSGRNEVVYDGSINASRSAPKTHARRKSGDDGSGDGEDTGSSVYRTSLASKDIRCSFVIDRVVTRYLEVTSTITTDQAPTRKSIPHGPKNCDVHV